MLSTFDRALIRLNRGAVIAILAAMAVMVFANVALRFLTDHSIVWVEEVSRYLMIWLTFLGAGLVLRYGGHVGIDTLQNAFPRYGLAIRLAIYALLLVFFIEMLWLGVRYAVVAWGQTTPVMQIPMGAVYVSIPLGFALLIIHLVLMTVPYLRRGEFLADTEFDADAAKL